MIYILGGWNDHDINDIHLYDIEAQIWGNVNVNNDYIPKSRRRHSCVMIENCIVMFGGFDGEFFNDLNVLDLKGIKWENINIDQSTIN
jgi:hypothetical protein